MPPPCQGLRVIDLTRSFTGALATMVLADAGAEVVKVEPPEGDPSREHYAALMWHRGKRSVVLDLKTEEGRTDAQRLADGADIVLAGFRPGVAARLGMDYDGLAARNPGLVYADLTGFGSTGPYANVRAYEGVVNAVAGRMDTHYETTGADRPAYPAQFLTSYGTALNTVQAILAALVVRERCGRGQRVETSLLKATMNFDLSYFVGWQLYDRGEFNGPFRYNGGGVPPYMTGRSKDGHWIQFGNLTPQTLFNFLQQLGLDWTLQDERYANQPVFAKGEDLRELQRLCLAALLEKDRDEWMRIFMENDIAAEPFRTTQEGMRHSQAIHNRNVVDLPDPDAGATKQLGVLAKFGTTPMEIGSPGTHGSAPTPPPFSPASTTPRPPRRGPPRPRRASPLEGLQVLEFASYIAGPYATALLADLGARVIKVEPVTGDAYRVMSFPRMCKTLQGKESLAIDLKDERGRRVLHKLIEDTDVLLHNFRPGVPERLGMDYETAKRLRPGIVYLYAGAYGSTGPHSHRTGFHPIAAAITGGPRYQLGGDLPTPSDVPLDLDGVQAMSNILRRTNESNPDPVAALTHCAAILMGLYHRARTGEGQYIETSMLSANLYANADDALQYEGKPERPLADTDFNGLSAVYRIYRCGEGWVFLACPQDDEWAALAGALGGRLADPAFSTKQGRREHDAQIAALLELAFAEASAEDWERRLLPAGVPCVRLADRDTGRFMTETPWALEAGLMKQVEHPSLGAYLRHAAPFDFSLTPANEGANCYLGEHTTNILRETGFSADEIAAMHADGAAVTHGV